MRAGRDQAGEVRHVDQQQRAAGVGDRAHPGEVDRARVGRAAGDQQARFEFGGERGERVVIDQAGLAVDAVVARVEPAPRQVRRGAVTEVPAGGEVEAQHALAGFERGKEHREVGLRTRMRLHVGVGAVEQFAGALDRRPLDDVDELAAAVEALAGVALEGLVGDRVAERVEHRAARDVLRRDQFDLRPLALELVGERIGDQRVALAQVLGKVSRHVCNLATPRGEGKIFLAVKA